ncbi:MAG TPA: ATPase, partial [Armatimonadetes bacterium]|nr:ATPase [Armatimonadota bacterium]
MRVGQMEELRGRLMDIDGRGYKAYQSIKGIYAMPGFTLFIDHVQADPFAPPSRIRVRVEQRVARLPRWAYANKVRAIACADFLARTFRQNIHRYVQGRRGTGNSGMMWIDAGGQEVLERTAVWVTEEFVEARISVGLPGHGRVVVAKQAMDMLIGELPRVVQRSLVYQNIDRTALSQHVQVVEDQEFVRGQLSELGLVAFIGDGSILPRESGATDLPMPEQQAVKFESPPSLRVQIRVPSGEVWTGMGIPVGVTLIVGGGYHGKSTLLNALQRCVYPHIPGDG